MLIRWNRKSLRIYSRVYVRQYCAKIDEAARNRMELIVPELAKRNGVTEKLKPTPNGMGTAVQFHSQPYGRSHFERICLRINEAGPHSMLLVAAVRAF